MPGLSEALSASVSDILKNLGVDVRTGDAVSEVTSTAIRTTGGEVFSSNLTVWAAGIRAPAFLHEIDGLETDRINRLAVNAHLQTTRDENIFAFGDCAAAPWEDDKVLPPRAQVAHQQASYLARQLVARSEGKATQPFKYKDYGSLVSLGRHETLGNLMGFIRGKGIRIEGMFASFMYWSLYRSHLMALNGFAKTALDTVTGWARRHTDPHVKLH